MRITAATAVVIVAVVMTALGDDPAAKRSSPEAEREQPATMLDALKVGDWVMFRPADQTYALIVVRKGENMTLKERRAKPAQASQKEAIHTPPYGFLRPDPQKKEADEIIEALGPANIFEVTAIRADHVALRSDVAEYFVSSNAIRLIKRDLRRPR